ncbi:MAG: helix-turn-helix domain-containing protein [Eubacterium sp.]|nr:helix-turn-helix domain-containing protein [Eubacterium sp.]
MTMKSKQELISKIVVLLSELIDVEEKSSAEIPQNDKKAEMLTIKECTALVKGLSEHTVRQLVWQDKISHIRAGQGKNGKILISKSALLSYFGIL